MTDKAKAIRYIYGMVVVYCVVAVLGLAVSSDAFSWMVVALPFVVGATVFHIGLYWWVLEAQWGNETSKDELVFLVKSCCSPKERANRFAELKERYAHADGIQHQRIAFWMVAEAAMLAGAAEVMNENSMAVAFFGVAGIVLNYTAMFSIWIVGERTLTAFNALAEISPIHRVFRNSVSLKLPTGTVLLHHVIPLAWSWVWVAVIAGTVARYW